MPSNVRKDDSKTPSNRGATLSAVVDDVFELGSSLSLLLLLPSEKLLFVVSFDAATTATSRLEHFAETSLSSLVPLLFFLFPKRFPILSLQSGSGQLSIFPVCSSQFGITSCRDRSRR